MRMRTQNHRIEDYPLASDAQNRNNFASWRQNELERMSPEQMLDISRSDYYCWCMDPWSYDQTKPKTEDWNLFVTTN